jgi:hypothetical protein
VFSLIGISGTPVQGSDGQHGFAPATTEEDVKNLSSSLSTTALEEITVQIGEKRTITGRPMHWLLWENNNRKVLTAGRGKDGAKFSSIKTSRDI